jgi:hypothetical protein
MGKTLSSSFSFGDLVRSSGKKNSEPLSSYSAVASCCNLDEISRSLIFFIIRYRLGKLPAHCIGRKNNNFLPKI